MNLRMLACLGALLLAPSIALGDDTSEEERGADCFYQNQMRHYQVVDDEHITVEVSNNRYYLVELWRPVRNLDWSRRIAFQSPTNRVCPRFSEVLVDGGVRIRSIRQISEEERDAFFNQDEEVGDGPVDGAEIEDVVDDGSGEFQEQDQEENS